jgi:2-succinyl-5-enolpyruvyl-6-hydroxy-3-cyclohexene-1-carboxylate synthase
MENLAAAWCRLFVRALVEAGVRHVVVSPGSRSTPLTLAVAEEPRLRAHLVIDERSAGFVALGIARLTERPAVLVCTSGTAGAHYFPAVIEASEAHVPLIVVTADRPWEAYDCGASQTMNQTRLFGVHVRHFAELGLPDESAGALRAVGRVAQQAARFAQHPMPGPVHVNARFRKPLEPTSVIDEAAWPELVRALLREPSSSVGVAPGLPAPTVAADEATLTRFVGLLQQARSGLIAVGPLPPSAARLAPLVKQLAHRLGFALLAESTSQLHAGPEEASAMAASTVIACFEPLLGVLSSKDEAPDLFVEIGRPLVSSAYLAFRERHAMTPAVHLADHGWNDPTGRALPLLGSVESLLRGALARLPEEARAPGAVAETLAAHALVVRSEVESALSSIPLTEGQAVRAVLASLPRKSVFVVGNSNPVRDVDLFGLGFPDGVRVLHQRGVAGIDGFVAGSFGAALALDDDDDEATSPVVCLLGDVTLAHDLGSLALVRAARRPVVFVVIDNGGGRIFDELPLARRTELSAPFAAFFTTPPALPFVSIARAFGLLAESVGSVVALRQELDKALAHAGATVLVAAVSTADYGGGQSPRKRLTASIQARLAAAGTPDK